MPDRIEFELSQAIYDAMRPAIKNMTLPELEALLEAAKGLSTTNCWFFTYWCKELLSRMAASEIHELKTAAKLRKAQ